MDGIIGATGKGIERLFDYGLAMIIVAIVGVVAFYTVKYLLMRCDLRYDKSIETIDKLQNKVMEVVEKNTQAFIGQQAALDGLKDAIRLNGGTNVRQR